jgi:hypothetical protein
VSARHLAEFDTCLSVVLNDVSSDVRLALLTHGVNAVRSASLDVVLPDVRHTPGILVVATNLYAILMLLLDHVLDHVGLVVLDFYACVVQRKDILHYL